MAETATTPTITAHDTDAAALPAEDDPQDAPADTDAAADLTASEPDRDTSDDTSDAAAEASERRSGNETSSKQVTVVPGVPRYHEQNCILIRFMNDDDVQKMTVSEAAETGCTPCRACQPDET